VCALPDDVLTQLRQRIQRYDTTGDPAALADADLQELAFGRYAQVVAARADVDAMVTLAEWWQRRAGEFGRVPRETQALRMLDTLLRRLSPSTAPDLTDAVAPLAATEVATILLDRFETGGDRDALRRARQLLSDVPDHTDFQYLLARTSAADFIVGGDLTDMDTAVRAATEAVRELPYDITWGHRMTTLAQALLLRHERNGDLADLEEVVRVSRAALDRVGPTTFLLTTLGNALIKRFDALDSLTDLDDGIELAQTAVRTAPPGHPNRPLALAVLLFGLLRRLQRLREPRDATEAAGWAKAALAVAPTDGPLAALLFNMAAMAMIHHYDVTRERVDLDEAVRLSERSCAIGQAYERHRWALMNHARVLWERYVAYGNKSDASTAVDTARAAVAAIHPEDPYYPLTHLSLAYYLLETGEVTESLRYAAIALTGFSPGHPNRARVLAVQAMALLRRHSQTGDASDLTAAADMARAATSSTAAAPEVRINGAALWHRAAVTALDNGMAARASETAVGLLPLLAWRGLDRVTQEARLALRNGLTSEAATHAIAEGSPARAVELLEQGRSVLWAQAVQTRTDLSVLRAVAPELADRLDRARSALSDSGPGLGSGLSWPAGSGGPAGSGWGPGGSGGSAGPAESGADRRRMAAEWDSLVAEVRRLPGFGSFLGVVPFEELSQAASAPVVYVTTSRFGSYALVVTPGHVRSVPLPWLDFTSTVRRADVLLAAQRDAEQRRNPVTRANLRHTMAATLRWLWDTVAAPILSTVDTDRLHWCPTGPLTFLPLHAAGRYHSTRPTGRTVPDRVVSSYTTTLTALARSGPRLPNPRLLAVGMPTTPGMAPLESVREELAAIPAVSTVIGPAATTAAVRAALPSYDWVHFACHGTQDPDSPQDSAIHLHDGPLTVRDLAAQGVGNADLAYLSACRTASGSTHLADEAIHLTAALQTAGYRHVIGTLWAITDRHAPEIAGAVYRELARTDPATALARALAPVRKSLPDRPEVWAPYVHTGPL
jgi:CHAT domain-containing protein/tetratricopeptide (TPR) repeat protein